MKKVTTVLFDLDTSIMSFHVDFVNAVNKVLRYYDYPLIEEDDYKDLSIWDFDSIVSKLFSQDLDSNHHDDIKEMLQLVLSQELGKYSHLHEQVDQLIDELYSQGIELYCISAHSEKDLKKILRKQNKIFNKMSLISIAHNKELYDYLKTFSQEELEYLLFVSQDLRKLKIFSEQKILTVESKWAHLEETEANTTFLKANYPLDIIDFID